MSELIVNRNSWQSVKALENIAEAVRRGFAVEIGPPKSGLNTADNLTCCLVIRRGEETWSVSNYGETQQLVRSLYLLDSVWSDIGEGKPTPQQQPIPTGRRHWAKSDGSDLFHWYEDADFYGDQRSLCGQPSPVGMASVSDNPPIEQACRRCLEIFHKRR